MKPVIEPALPSDDDRAALLVDARAGADLALDDESPPRIAAPVSEPALPSITTTPDIMFSHADQPTRPLMWTSGPSMMPHAEVAEAALEA